MKSFLDKRGREIRLTVDDDLGAVEAHHGSRRIGALMFDDCDGLPMLQHASVEADYQRSGIGLEMMRTAVEAMDRFLIPGRFWLPGTQVNYYSTEGMALIQKCITEGLIDESWFADVAEWQDQEEEESTS